MPTLAGPPINSTMSSPPSSTTQQPLLVVLGATGLQGGAVLRHFARTPTLKQSFRLRGISRDPSSTKSQALVALGIEIVAADLHDPASLQRALVDATHLFANTDSNQIIQDVIRHPEKLPKADPPLTPTTYAAGIEHQFGSNIAQAALQTATLRCIVWSSLPSPRKWSGGRLPHVAMFDTKEDIADVWMATEGIKEKLRLVIVGFYAENAVNLPQFMAPKKGDDGVYELALPLKGDTVVPFADVELDLGRWVRALFDAPPGTQLVGSTEMLAWSEWLRLWGERNHVPTRFRQAAQGEFAAKAPAYGLAVEEEYRFMEEYGFSGGNPQVITPDQLRQTGIPIEQSNMADHINRFDWSSIL